MKLKKLSSVEVTAAYDSSNELANRLFKNVQNSQTSNFFSLPTDCPQRNERLGWTGDAQVFSKAASYNADVYNLYRNWLRTLRACQFVDGSLPVFQVKRLKDGRLARPSVENAKRFLGLPYDVYFLPENEGLYCSELVYVSYRQKDGKPLFTSAPMNFRNADGEFPLYWEQLFARIGQPIPQDVPGTNPQAMSAEPVLRPVDVKIP